MNISIGTRFAIVFGMEAIGRKHIIIAEDEPVLLRSLAMILQKAGWSVTIAHDGHEAIENVIACRIRNQPADVLLFDISMPGLSGFQMMEELFRRDIQLPWVAMSGQDASSTETELLQRGCGFLLSKPFDNSELLATVEAALHGVKPSVPVTTGESAHGSENK